MTRAQQRYRLAIAVLTLDATLMASLVYLATQGVNVSGENVLFMAVGSALTWGGTVLAFYFGTSESSAHKTEVMDKMVEGPTGNPGDPVHTQEE